MRALYLILSLSWGKSSLKLRFVLILAFGFLCLSRVTAALVPFLYKFLFDAISKFVPGQNYSLVPVIFIVLLYSAVRFLSQIFNESKEMSFVLVEQNAAKILASESFSHLQRMGIGFHASKKIGEVSKIIDRGVKAVETFLRFVTFSIFPVFLEAMFVCTLMLIFYPYYYFVLLAAALVLYCLYTIVITHWRTAYIKKMKLADNEAAFRATDSLINYETVKYFNNQKYEIKRYSDLVGNYASLAIKNRWYLSVLNVGQGLIIASALVGINLEVIFDILNANATIGDFALVNTYLLQLYVPLGNLGFAYREIRLACMDIDSLRELLLEKHGRNVSDCGDEFVFREGTVEFKDVSFGYSDDLPILKNLSFRIERGKTLAVVGESGSGKSTVSKLLFGFYPPSKGKILVDGQDLRHLDTESFQRYMGVVPQDVTLFNDTIFNNIAYSDPENAKLSDVVTVAKLANIHDFIMSTKAQYDTIVGERGLKLSGGEKQRVAIARMLLKKDARILIFDEASSSLDSKTEYAIMESIRNIGKNSTSFVIAHRLSTILYADEILVLSHGEVVERGSHSELLAIKGIYYSLLQNQDRQN